MLYNLRSMMLSPNTMRALLFLCLLGMALLAAFYLRQRNLSITEYVGWGLLIVLLPLIGPFLVILSTPGVGRNRRPS